TRATTFRATAIVGGFLLALLMIMTVSRAAFSDTTDNTDNSWAAGEVRLTDDDGGLALFTATNIAPGDNGDGCIAVIYEGTVTAAVVLSSVSTAGSTGLAPALDVTIDRYPDAGCAGTASPVFAGTLAAANGASFPDSWTATAFGETQYYGITWTFQSGAGNSYQGTGAEAAFTWQATSS
ncbi:MAG: hypothetical protein ABFS21_12920, partial [Actinomycetota bacterium]